MIKEKLNYWLILASIALLLLDYFGFLKRVKGPVEGVTFYVKKQLYQTSLTVTSFSNVVFQYPRIDKIISEKDNLKRKNDELSLKVKLLTEENSKLRKQLEAPLPPAFKFVPANVLGVTRFMEIGVGEEDKVEKEMPVVDGDVLIGKIVTTSAHRSMVMLPTDLKIRIPAKTSRGTKGIIMGKSGTDIVMDKVLQKDPLFLDDLVFTSGESNFPQNLLVGKIVHIISDDVKVYKQAKIEPSVDYKRETTVFVVLTK